MSPSLLRRVFKKRTPEDKLTTMLVELEKAFPCGGPAIVQALVAEHPEDWTTCFIRVMNKVLKQLILQKELPNVELEDHKDELVSAQTLGVSRGAKHTAKSSFSSSKTSGTN